MKVARQSPGEGKALVLRQTLREVGSAPATGRSVDLEQADVLGLSAQAQPIWAIALAAPALVGEWVQYRWPNLASSEL